MSDPRHTVKLEPAEARIAAGRQQEPVEELMARYRYLSLSRAEPAQRLDVLRQLMAADGTNSYWKLDAEELEVARLGTLRSDSAAAVRRGDLAAIQKLLAELNAGLWIAPVPADLKDTLTNAAAALQASTMVLKLIGLVPRVRAAHASLSYDEGRAVFLEWGAAVKESRLAVPSELRQEILPLARWLEEQDERREHDREFRADCAALAVCIQSNGPLEQLNRLYRAVAQYRMAIPDDLLASYHRAVESEKRRLRADKRKQILLGTFLVGLIGLALAAVAYVIFGFGPK